MYSLELCIELGSCNTTIYKRGVGVVLREPTLAIIKPMGKSVHMVACGERAKRMFGKTGENEVFVSPIVEGVIKNVDLTQKILASFLSKIVKYSFVKPAIKLVAILPMGLSKEECDDYKKVFYAYGFAKIDFVFGAVTASLADCTHTHCGRASILVNIGGGKTEVASVVDGKILSGCTINVGGNSVDKATIEHLQQSKELILGKLQATKLKEEIGSLYQTDTSSMEVEAFDSFASKQVVSVVAAKDILKPIYENYFRILQTLQAFVNKLSPEVLEDVRNDGILLCGGGSLVSGVEQFFKKYIGISVFVLENPEILTVVGSEKLFADYNLLQKVVEEN